MAGIPLWFWVKYLWGITRDDKWPGDIRARASELLAGIRQEHQGEGL